jgi:hypothetical protein
MPPLPLLPQVVSVSGLLGHPLRTILDELYRALYTNYEDINGDQARRRHSAPLPRASPAWAQGRRRRRAV